ncbi:MAG: apolipoprotein N-acyltransferase [Bacteroidia bacterium]
MLSQEKINHLVLLILVVVSGVLGYFAWSPYSAAFLIFVAFVPTLLMEHLVFQAAHRNSNWVVFFYAFLNFLVWNGLTTYWVYLASLPGAIMAVFCNSILQAVPVLIYHVSKKHIGQRLSLLTLICLWISLEYLHLNWDLAWPWLNLGNVFAMHPNWVQWYEFTGALGGSLWVLLVNILIFEVILRYSMGREKHKPMFRIWPELLLILLLITAPFILSWFLYRQTFPAVRTAEVVVVQPNVDPYNDKFDRSTMNTQLNNLLRISDSLLTKDTELLIWPETALPWNSEITTVNETEPMQQIIAFLKKHPQMKLITGFSPYLIYPEGKGKTPTARQVQNSANYYDVFNSALLIDGTGQYQYYHKNKLVPGVEIMPYPAVFSFLEDFAIDLGGTSGSLGRSDKAIVFPVDSSIRAAPIICYESIFGDYTGDFIADGANIIALITNDGWWGNSDGYKQHLHYASLRAVETRKAIARSANTGISAFFDTRGNIMEQTGFWVPGGLRANLPINNHITFYVKYGDYIGRIASYLSVFLLLIVIMRKITRKRARYIR